MSLIRLLGTASGTSVSHRDSRSCRRAQSSQGCPWTRCCSLLQKRLWICVKMIKQNYSLFFQLYNSKLVSLRGQMLNTYPTAYQRAGKAGRQPPHHVPEKHCPALHPTCMHPPSPSPSETSCSGLRAKRVKRPFLASWHYEGCHPRAISAAATNNSDVFL